MKNYESEERAKGKGRKYFIYPGKDNDSHTLISNEWMKNRLRVCKWLSDAENYEKAPLMNAGVCGGDFEGILKLVTHIGEALSTRNPNENCNMPAYNIVLNQYFEGQYRTGTPFTSPFFRNDKDPKFYIRHK